MMGPLLELFLKWGTNKEAKASIVKDVLLAISFLLVSVSLTAKGATLSEDTNAPSSAHFEFFETHTFSPPNNPNAVLVLAGDLNQAGTLVTQPAWRTLAEANGVGLLSLGFKLKSQTTDRNAVGEELAQEINRAIQQKFKGNPKRIAYASGPSAKWLLRAIQAEPGKWQFWGVRGAVEYPMVSGQAEGKPFPPGIIMTVSRDEYADAWRYFNDLRRLNAGGQKMTFVGSEKDLIDNAFLERFYRQFVTAVYQGQVQGAGYWL